MSLNKSNGAAGDLCWRSDYCGRLSEIEEDLVREAVNSWIARGPSQLLSIPDYINDKAVKQSSLRLLFSERWRDPASASSIVRSPVH